MLKTPLSTFYSFPEWGEGGIHGMTLSSLHECCWHEKPSMCLQTNISFMLTGKVFMLPGHMKAGHIMALNKILKYEWGSGSSSSLIAIIYSHCPHLVHISIDLRCCASDDGGVPLPTQTAHWLHQEGQQWRLPGQSSCSLGSGSGDWTSTETGNPCHIHTSFSQRRLYSFSLWRCPNSHNVYICIYIFYSILYIYIYTQYTFPSELLSAFIIFVKDVIYQGLTGCIWVWAFKQV